jgi:hypothetical protein
MKLKYLDWQALFDVKPRFLWAKLWCRDRFTEARFVIFCGQNYDAGVDSPNALKTRSQSYERELQRRRCKNLQRYE